VVEFELMALCMLFGIQLNTVTMCIFVMNFGLVFGAFGDVTRPSTSVHARWARALARKSTRAPDPCCVRYRI
jgi:hypothetical protein